MDFLRDPLLLLTLRSDKVLIATLSLFVWSTVMSRSLLLFNQCRLRLTIGRAAVPGLLLDILTVYWCYNKSLFFLIILKFRQSIWCSWYHKNLRVVAIHLLPNRLVKRSELLSKVLRRKTFSLTQTFYPRIYMHAIHARYQRIFYPREFMRAIKIDTRALNFSQRPMPLWYHPNTHLFF